MSNVTSESDEKDLVAEVLAIGDEITSGQLLDTNSQWLSQQLEDIGVRVLLHTSVGDELEPMAKIFRQAFERADIVISTGGLGPTADDLTRSALAGALGKPLVKDEQALADIRALYARRRRDMPQRNELQAFFPEGTDPIPNANGTAPGIYAEISRGSRAPARFFCLPGPPSEMREMYHQSVAPSLREFGAGQQVIRHRVIKCFGAGESQVEEMLGDLIERGRNPLVGINASKTSILLRITAAGATEEACAAAMEPTVALIRQTLGPLVFGEGSDELQDAVVTLLRQREATLATAEWGTRGEATQLLASVAEGEGFFGGGVVVRDKQRLVHGLGIDSPKVDGLDIMEEETARAMAEDVRVRFRSDYGLASAAFPSHDPDLQPPATVYFALAGPNGVRVRAVRYAIHPSMLSVFCVKQMLDLARREMMDE